MTSLKILNATVVILFHYFAFGMNEALAWGTVSYYRFEEGIAGQAATGTGSILDSSGNGLNGTPITYTSGFPNYNSNIPLNNIQNLNLPNKLSLGLTYLSNITIAPSNKFNLLQNLTLEAFINPGDFSRADQRIFLWGDSRGGYDPYKFLLNNNSLLFEIQDANNNGASLSIKLPTLNQWYHIAGTLDDITGNLSLYLDGVLKGSLTTAIRPFALTDLTLNPLAEIGTNYLGLVDEVRISDQALRPDQFLNSVNIPEPSGLILSAIGLLSFGICRKVTFLQFKRKISNRIASYKQGTDTLS